MSETSASNATSATQFTFDRLIDLSTGIEHQAVHEPWKPSITRVMNHDDEAAVDWLKHTFGAEPKDMTNSGGKGPAFEEVTAITHCGTHVDAPWHYGPLSEGKKAKTIEECPIEWFFGDGVRLDLRHKQPNDKITVADLEQALEAIDYELKPMDIVMIWNGRDKHLGTEEYFEQPGMTRESTLWLTEQGIKVIGVDMYGFDRKFSDMADEFQATGDGSVIWEAHFAGLEREYCQIEKLVNLDKLPAATGFKVACFPIKIENGSAGWSRVVAFA